MNRNQDITLILMLFAACVFGYCRPAHSADISVICIAPTVDDRGQPVGTLAGFRVYYGQSATALTNKLDSSTCSFSVKGLSAGTWYFAVTARTATEESALSNLSPLTITQPPVSIVEQPGTWTLKKGTSNVQAGIADYAACKALAASKATSTTTKYYCTVSNAVTVKIQ